MPQWPARYESMEDWFETEKKSGYDMKGYVEKYGLPADYIAGKGHLTDEFKLPHHITFSDESRYSFPGQLGGKWVQRGGVWHFYPSMFNIQQHGVDKLQKYFKNYEPDSILHFPWEE